MKVTTIEVRGQQFEVHVDSGGMFYVDDIGMPGMHREPTLAALRAQLTAATRAAHARIAVEFERLHDDGTTECGTVTGVHVNRNYLVRYDGVKNVQQMRTYEMTGCTTRLTDEQRAEWKAIVEAKNEAARRYSEFRERLRMDVVDAVVTALEKPDATG